MLKKTRRTVARPFAITTLQIILFILLWAMPLTAQEAASPNPLLRGWGDLLLGQTFAETEEVLQRDAAFAYRGSPDVSLRLSDRQLVIDAPGRNFVDRALVQFHETQSYIITLFMNPARIDYFSLFQQLSARYGAPAELSPQVARWHDELTEIALERPAVVKYIDLATFNGLRQARRVERAIFDQQRERFLDAF